MNAYQWSVLASFFIIAVNEIRLFELNDVTRYTISRCIFVWVCGVYVFAISVISVFILFLKLGQL